ncbi:MAG: hypothetical protein IKI49_04085 [Oscillospiraceae bacterium]|nr:hypothetical protein [Oscillospiraceae bacterium]
MSDKDLYRNDGFDVASPEEEFSLESILAEFKGDAYIAGDKKTPEDILNAATERIVREANGEIFDDEEAICETAEKRVNKRDDGDFFADIDEPETKPEMPELPESNISNEDDDLLAAFFSDTDAEKESVQYSSKDSEESYKDEISRIVEEETRKEEAANRAAAKFGRRSAKRSRRETIYEYDDSADGYHDLDAENEPELEFEPEEEPPLEELAAQSGKGLRSMSIRSAIAFVICAAMAIFTYIFEAGKPVPFGIGANAGYVAGILLLLHLVVMALSVDVLISGVKTLLDGVFGGETLVLISNVVSVVQAFAAILGKKEISFLPFCTISAITLMFALRGKRAYALAACDTLRSAVSAASPFSVISDSDSVPERTVLKKTSCTADGFYRNFIQTDISDTAYGIFAPIAFVLSLVLAALISALSKNTSGFLYIFSALVAVSASFSVMLTFALPFKRVAKKARRTGAAIAGWGGACSISDSDSVIVTDEDVFPTGTLTISSIKIFEGFSREKALSYTASMIIASGSGASKVFAELLKSQKIQMDAVSDFAYYQGGGISGIIRGERVMVGSAAYMNLMGVRIPDSLNTKDAMFTVINDTLTTVVVLNYIPANSVQKALVAMMRTKTTMLFAVRDFNITPAMVQKKFKVNISNFEHLPVEECYVASDEKPGKNQDSAAILSRGGLAPIADVVVMGSQLKLLSTLLTAVSIITSVIGVLFITLLFLRSGTVLCGSVLTYMLLVQAAVLIISCFVRRK